MTASRRQEQLHKALEDFDPVVEETVVWDDGKLHLLVRSYVTSHSPPLQFISSVRCIVFRGSEVLRVRNPRDVHIVPGGRIEDGEGIADALRRELLEETGWTIQNEVLLGFMHFQVASGPAQPDFLQLVYTADALEFSSEARIPDDYEIEAKFVAIGEVGALSASQRVFLQDALSQREPS